MFRPSLAAFLSVAGMLLIQGSVGAQTCTTCPLPRNASGFTPSSSFSGYTPSSSFSGYPSSLMGSIPSGTGMGSVAPSLMGSISSGGGVGSYGAVGSSFPGSLMGSVGSGAGVAGTYASAPVPGHHTGHGHHAITINVYVNVCPTPHGSAPAHYTPTHCAPTHCAPTHCAPVSRCYQCPTR